MSTQNSNLPTRAQILEILQEIRNPFAPDFAESIVDAGFITAPLSRLIENKPQIGLILDTKGADVEGSKALKGVIAAALSQKTGIADIQVMGGAPAAGGKHNLISNMAAKPTGGGHRPLGSGATVNDALAKVKNIILVASGHAKSSPYWYQQ